MVAPNTTTPPADFWQIRVADGRIFWASNLSGNDAFLFFRIVTAEGRRTRRAVFAAGSEIAQKTPARMNAGRLEVAQ